MKKWNTSIWSLMNTCFHSPFHRSRWDVIERESTQPVKRASNESRFEMGGTECINRKRWNVCVKACEKCEGFWARMSPTFSDPSIFIPYDFHSPSGWQGTSYTQSDSIMEPTLEGTSPIESDDDENEVYWHRPQDVYTVYPLETNPSLLSCTRWGVIVSSRVIVGE